MEGKREEKEEKVGNILQVCNLFGIEQERVLAAFVFGSTVWGKQNAKDLDLFVIVEDEYFPLEGKVFHNKQNVDICLYTLETWKKGLENHNSTFWVCKFLPSQFKWKQRVDVFGGVKLELSKLRASVSRERERTVCKALHKLEERDVPKSKKCVRHALRDSLFAFQLVEHGRVVEWRPVEMERFEKEIDECADEEWGEQLKKIWKPLLNNTFKNRLKKLIPQTSLVDHSHLYNK